MLTGAVTMPNSKVVNLFNKLECVRNKVPIEELKTFKKEFASKVS